MSVESLRSEFHLIADGEINRKIAYSQIGEIEAKHIFLCLPGLLETRESFHPLLEMAEPFYDCCWLSFDYCGRGDSDPLPPTASYSFSKYLADIENVIESLILPRRIDLNQKFHLIGTSMGGILAMHLLSRFQHKVDSVVLNDIGLYLQWSSLMNLYQNLKEPDDQLKKLRVDIRALDAVQSRSHFDLPYEFDLFGMRFHALLENFKGLVILLHNDKSPICPLSIAIQSKSKYTNLNVLTLENDGHPVTWEKSAVIKLSRLIRLKLKVIDNVDQQVPTPSPEIFQTTSAFSLDFIDTFLKTSQAYLESTTEDPKLWLIQLAKRLKFWMGSYS